jgi:hypothetical protein
VPTETLKQQAGIFMGEYASSTVAGIPGHEVRAVELFLGRGDLQHRWHAVPLHRQQEAAVRTDGFTFWRQTPA